MVQTIPFAADANPANIRIANACPAQAMGPAERRDLALRALGGAFTISALAQQADVSRKFVHQQVDIAQQALEQAFAPSPNDDDDVLGHLPVTKKWLRQNVLSLLLNCRSCYRGVIHHFHDCLGRHVSLGAIHNIVREAVGHARAINDKYVLDTINVGLIDEIFQAQQPVLVGVDGASTYCFLLSQDVFALAGPACADRRDLYDFVVAELRGRAPLCAYRLNPLCTFLDNHRDQLLGFADKLDADLAELATRFQVSQDTLRELLRLQQLSDANPRRWHGEAKLRQQLHDRFHDISAAVRDVADRTVRASSLVENLNSRLRNDFTLRRHLGADYLALLQFYLNHHCFDRSECPDRVGKSPAELLTGQTHPHWLAMLGYQPFSRN